MSPSWIDTTRVGAYRPFLLVLRAPVVATPLGGHGRRESAQRHARREVVGEDLPPAGQVADGDALATRCRRRDGSARRDGRCRLGGAARDASQAVDCAHGVAVGARADSRVHVGPGARPQRGDAPAGAYEAVGGDAGVVARRPPRQADAACAGTGRQTRGRGRRAAGPPSPSDAPACRGRDAACSAMRPRRTARRMTARRNRPALPADDEPRGDHGPGLAAQRAEAEYVPAAVDGRGPDGTGAGRRSRAERERHGRRRRDDDRQTHRFPG